MSGDRASVRSVRRLAPPLSSWLPCVALDGIDPWETVRSRYIEVARACWLVAVLNAPLRRCGCWNAGGSRRVILSRRRDAVGCHWFEPIDRLDAHGREPPRSFCRAA
jgi:hypothetical protein